MTSDRHPNPRRRWWATPLLLVLAAGAPAADARGADARGAEVQRIVSLAPSVTESVFALGLGDRLVGVSVYCDYPPEVAKIDRVGTFLTPNVEAIVAKRPDIIIAVPTPGNQNPVRALQALGLKVLIVDPHSVAEIEQSLLTIGAAVGREAMAKTVVADIERRLDELRARLADAPPRRVLMVVGQTPLIAVGTHTVQDELIRMAKGINLGANAGASWPRLSLEFVINAAPEVIIDTTMGNEERAGAGAALDFWNAFPTLPAVRDGRVFGYKQYQLLRPGPRLPEMLESIARFVHPERFAESPRSTVQSPRVAEPTPSRAPQSGAPAHPIGALDVGPWTMHRGRRCPI